MPFKILLERVKHNFTNDLNDKSGGMVSEVTSWETGETKEKSLLYNALQRIFSEFKGNELEMRKAHLYLILNSDFSFNDELAKEDDFCHIVKSAPIIDKYLLVETILLLNLNQFIHEIIVFGHIAISLEYLEILMCELHSKKSRRNYFAVENILLAVNKRLAGLENELNPKDQEFKKVGCKLSFYFKEFLSIFSPPYGKNEIGYVIKSLLSLLQSCLHEQCNYSAKIDEKYSVYSLLQMNFKIENPTTGCLDLHKKEDILCIVNMLESSLNLISVSTWMSWSKCLWQSPVDSGECSKTMQQVIGEQAFLCKQELQRFTDNFPAVATLSSVLTNMEIKPVTDEDEIEKVKDVGQIICKVKDSSRSLESKKKWLLALLKYSWNSKEEECVNCIEEFGNMLDCVEDIHLLQKKVGDVLSGVSVCQSSESSTLDSKNKEVSEISRPLRDKMMNLVFEAYPHIPVEDQGKLVGIFYKEFGLNNFFQANDFEKRVMETLNKAVNVNETKDQLMSDLCILCLQSPMEVVQRLLVLGIGCYSQISFVIEALQTLSSVCQLHVVGKQSTQPTPEPPDPDIVLLCHQLSLLMKQNNWNETENSNLLHMVVQCLDSSLLLHENLLDNCIIPGLEECMKTASWKSINMFTEILNTVLTMPSAFMGEISNPAVILAYLMFILEKGRDHLRKHFSVAAASTCELIISCIPVILENMLHQASFKEKDLHWLRNKVLSASPQCQYYYNKLWPVDSKTLIKDFQSLIMLTVYNEREFDEKKMLQLLTKDHSLLSHFLFKLLPSCTTSEWLNTANVFKSIIPKSIEKQENLYWNLLHQISSVLLIMIMAARRKYTSGDKNILYCIELWFKNYVRIIKEEFWPCCKYFNAAESTEIFMTIIRILEEIPEEENIRETCSFLALSILSAVFKTVLPQNHESNYMNSKNVDHNPYFMKLIACISLMSEGESKKGLARMALEILC
ncbi:uncharacterized protein [Hetaerina americana]|uniref:uncharacterized protein n=1 Tax=Hetaerina americana TaxID=62018 RepID=UPI003A7F408A